MNDSQLKDNPAPLPPPWQTEAVLKDNSKIKIVASDNLPLNNSQLPREALLSLSPVINSRQTYLIAYDNNQNPLGFIVFDFQEDNQDIVDLAYNFVFPSSRQHGLGTILLSSAFEWAKAENIKTLRSGIKSVLKLGQNGPEINLDPDSDGNWRSYITRVRSRYKDGSIPNSKIIQIIIHNNLVDLLIQTDIAVNQTGETEQISPLPEDPEQLFNLIKAEHIPIELDYSALLMLINSEFEDLVFQYKKRLNPAETIKSYHARKTRL